MRSKAACVALLSFVAVACSDITGTDTDTNNLTHGVPTPPSRFAVTTQVDLAQTADGSGVIDDATEPLDRLQKDPAKTILDVLTVKKMPVVTTLKSKIPDALEGSFAKWFNDDVLSRKIDGVEAGKALTSVRTDLAAMAGKFEILSTLDLTPGEEGTSTAKHTVTGMAFTRGADRMVVDTPDLVSSVSPAENVSLQTEAGKAKLGEHTLSIPLGEFATQALGLFGKDKVVDAGLRFAIGQIVDCGAISKSVAKRCIGTICIGHETEIKQVCDAGLDVVVDLTLDALKKLKIDPLRFIGGDAKILDALSPGDGGGITGIWKGAANLGKGESPISSKFTGKLVSAPPAGE
jgi:hypothetical protein